MLRFFDQMQTRFKMSNTKACLPVALVFVASNIYILLNNYLESYMPLPSPSLSPRPLSSEPAAIASTNQSKCFEFLDEYPMAMGCHKSVYRVKPCDTNIDEGGDGTTPIYILSIANDTVAPTSLEAEMLSRSVPGTVPTVYATCSHQDGSNYFLVQEMLLHGKSYMDAIKRDKAMDIFSPVARLRIAASGFDALKLFDNFPLPLSGDAAVQKNLEFSSGASNETGWFTTRLIDQNDPSSTEWRYEKVFYRDFGHSQVGINLDERKMKVIDILSPFYLLYEGVNKGVGSQLKCTSNEDCNKGYKTRFVKTESYRFAKTREAHASPNMTDQVNDISCDTARGLCMGLDDRTLTYFMWWYFKITLQPLQSSRKLFKKKSHQQQHQIQQRLNHLLEQIRHEERDERPIPSTVAAELYAIANMLEKSGHVDVINKEAIEATKTPWVTEPWSKVCKGIINRVRHAVRMVEDKVTLVGDCELRQRRYSTAVY